MNRVSTIGSSKKSQILRKVIKNRYLYIMLIPGVLFFIIFHYTPMGGLIMAFQDYNIFKGIFASEWVGLDNFKEIFGMKDFWNVLRNTLIISTYKIVFVFPVPIILALLMNEMKKNFFVKFVQTTLYLPHFISWVVISGIMLAVLSPNFGIAGDFFKVLGMKPVYLMADPRYFRALVVLSDMWKEVGWGTIIYMASLTLIDSAMYEAAIMDGANRWKQIWHITLPSIANVIVLLLILRIGTIMQAGFDQIFVLRNDMVIEVGEIFDTYVYHYGIGQNHYSIATAVGLFKSVVAAFLIIATDRISKIFGAEGLF